MEIGWRSVGARGKRPADDVLVPGTRELDRAIGDVQDLRASVARIPAYRFKQLIYIFS